MMRKVSILILTVALAALFAMPAMATESRQIALGGPSQYIEDDYNVFMWPGTLPSYANIVFMDIGLASEWDDGYEYQWLEMKIGATYGLGEDNKYGVVGMWFYHMDQGLNPWMYDDEEYPCEWYGMGLFSDYLDHKFALMWGYQMEGASFGIGFMHAQNQWKSTDTSPEYTSDEKYAYTKLNAGVRFDVGDAAYMDVAFDLAVASVTDDYTSGTDTEKIEADKNKAYGIRARMFYEWQEYFTWVPYFSYDAFDFNLKSSDADWEYYGDKANRLMFGLGSNITVNEDNLVIFAVDIYDYVNRKPSQNPEGESYEMKFVTFPRFYLGLESDINDWLTFRAGGMHELVKFESDCKTSDTNSETDKYTWANFDMYLGLGFHVGDFDIDCVLNPEVPLRMGYWLTGYQDCCGDYESGYGILMVSAKYSF
jgi:hypothetical protein